MTTDGNFNANNINTVKIPTINSVIGGTLVPTCGGGGGGLDTGIGLYYDSTNIYYLGTNTNYFSVAPFNDPLNAFIHYNAQLTPTNAPTNTYPTAIGSYFYVYGTKSTLGVLQDGNIWKAHVDSPLAWIDTGIATASSSIYGMIYNNGTNIYVIGGVDTGGIYLNTIDVAAIASPTSFSASPNFLPVALANATIVTVGSDLYMYGGSDAGLSAVDTIYSSTVADPTTWVDTLATIPAQIMGACAYVSDTTIYLYGGDTPISDLSTIYTAPIGTPTSFTLSGTSLPTTNNHAKIFRSGDYLYMIGTNIMRAEVSNPLVWTQMGASAALATAQTATHVAVDSSKIYAFGGLNSGGAASTVIQSASILNPGYWENEIDVLPAALYGGQLVKTKSYYYIIGGDGVTGNVYRAALATPKTWLLAGAGADGPIKMYGKAIIIEDHIFYLGGEDATNVTSSFGYRASIIDGEIVEWKTIAGADMSIAAPIAVSRHCIIQAGNYLYLIGGYISTGPMVFNLNIYRAQINRIVGHSGFTTWTVVGAITTGFHGASVAIINNTVYLVGGSTAGVAVSDDYVFSANMTELANGSAIFVEENTAVITAFSDSVATCVNDDLYFVGGRGASANGSTILYRNQASATHNLILPKVPESTASLPTLDLNTGTLGSYSSFQRTGFLPWLVTNK